MCIVIFFFFFNDTATTEIYTLSLHDALPISGGTGDRHSADGGHRGHWCDRHPAGAGAAVDHRQAPDAGEGREGDGGAAAVQADRKSTRLNSSHANISYAVFCLKKKKTTR